MKLLIVLTGTSKDPTLLFPSLSYFTSPISSLRMYSLTRSAGHAYFKLANNFKFFFYFRWILTPYIVVIWASAAVYDKKHGLIGYPKGLDHFVLAILIIAVITLVVRIALVAFRTFRK